MRISDWSSDVCSSDLTGGGGVVGIAVIGIGRKAENHVRADIALIGRTETAGQVGRARRNRALEILLEHQALPRVEEGAARRRVRIRGQGARRIGIGIALADIVVEAVAEDRKSVVSGKSVSVSVDLGGRRIIKKKKKK